MIWFLRHGDAEDTTPDAERKLTEKGRHQSKAAGEALRAIGVELDVCLTSPRVRAHETAVLACAELRADVDVVIEPRLAGGHFDARELTAGLDEVLLVGHEPDFSDVVEELTGGRVDMKKGGVAAVRLDGSRGELIALLRPRELARIR